MNEFKNFLCQNHHLCQIYIWVTMNLFNYLFYFIFYCQSFINNFLQGFRIYENLKFFIHIIPQFKFYYSLIYFSSNLKIQSYY